MKEIKLSIITPVFNNFSFIEKCIQNVNEQEVEGIEHLIIDGASSDGTVEVIKQYAERFSHIKLISEKDKGQSEAMNKGIILAKGEYITFLNVDDYFSENSLKEVLSFINSEKAPIFLVGNCNVWNEDGTLQYVNRPSKLKPWHLLSGYYLPVNPSAYFYRKKIHDLVGPYNEQNHFNMDIEFLIKAALVSEMKYESAIWGNFRLLPNTKTVSDQSSGNIEKRKKELYNKYLAQVSIKIYLFTKCVVYRNKVDRLLYKFKKVIILPFDKVYYKLKLILNSSK
jgi:glycosyltransferase involved in cell wall biosynthesis